MHSNTPCAENADAVSTHPPACRIITPESLAMRRELMNFIDPQVILFNGRGFVHVKEDSMTGFGWPVFPPVDLRSYDFHLNILDNASGTIIRDDVPAMWKQWKETGTGTDRAFQDLSSMPTELSAGAGLEAVWFGVFGLQPQMDGSLPSVFIDIAGNNLLGHHVIQMAFRIRHRLIPCEDPASRTVIEQPADVLKVLPQ